MGRVTIGFRNALLSISYKIQRRGEESAVFIHGLGGCKECFQGVWDFPGYERFTILTFDLPGFGDSNKPLAFDYSIESQAALTKLLLQQLKLKRVRVIGQSMGGAVGLLLANSAKTIVDSFICLEGNLIAEDCTGSREAVQYSLGDFQKEGFDRLKKEVATGADAAYLRCLAKSSPYAFYRSSESLVKWSDSGRLLDLFLGLNVPKCYIYGEQNAVAPVMKRLSSVPKIMIPQAGHGMMADNPQGFYTSLLGVL